jgi:predicted RNase H-like HicB family nuclease
MLCWSWYLATPLVTPVADQVSLTGTVAVSSTELAGRLCSGAGAGGGPIKLDDKSVGLLGVTCVVGGEVANLGCAIGANDRRVLWIVSSLGNVLGSGGAVANLLDARGFGARGAGSIVGCKPERDALVGPGTRRAGVATFRSTCGGDRCCGIRRGRSQRQAVVIPPEIACTSQRGAITQGRTREEARENLKDAIHMMLEVLREDAEKDLEGKDVTREHIEV